MPVNLADLSGDLQAWLNAEQHTLERVHRLRGGGGWEQWCVIQFLLHQIAARPGLDYEREYESLVGGGIVDIAYNRDTGVPEEGYPVVLTEWKVGHAAAALATNFVSDISKLSGIRGHAAAMVIALTDQVLNFPAGSMTVLTAPHAHVRIYHTTAQAWRQFGGW